MLPETNWMISGSSKWQGCPLDISSCPLTSTRVFSFRVVRLLLDIPPHSVLMWVSYFPSPFHSCLEYIQNHTKQLRHGPSHIYKYAYMHIFLCLSMGLLNTAGPGASSKAAPSPPPDSGKYSAAHIEACLKHFLGSFHIYSVCAFLLCLYPQPGVSALNPLYPSCLLLLEWLLKTISNARGTPKQEMLCKSRLMCAAHFGIARICSCLSFHSCACPKQASRRSSQSGARASRVSTTRFRPLFPPYTPQSSRITYACKFTCTLSDAHAGADMHTHAH